MIDCNNNVRVWRIRFYKMKIQVLEFSKCKFENLNFLKFSIEFFGDYSERLKKF